MGKYAGGTNYAKSTSPTSDHTMDPGVFGGKLRVMQDYFMPGTTTMKSGQYVIVGTKLPTGSQVVDIIFGYPVSSPAIGEIGGSSSYVTVGDEGDADRYITQVQISTAAVVVGPNTTTGINYVVTGITDNYIRISTIADVDANNTCEVSTGPIKISVLYVVE
jgi:hypothetical protein